jgi:hypothetical protein
MSFDHLCGWVPPSTEQIIETVNALPYPKFAQAAPHLMGEVATDMYLYKAWKDVLGQYPAYIAQQIGDCTSFGGGHAVDLLETIQIAIGKKAESYKETCTEAIYGIGREIAGMLGGGDGCYGGAIARAVSEVGTVSREVVGPYSGNRAKTWGGRGGVPEDVKSKCKDHKIKTTSMVDSWDELVAAISNGYPVTVASNQGFTMTRNSKGICEASGSWAHQMMICGIMYVGTPDECAVIAQSWGPNVPDGPTPNDMPNNTFGARKSVVTRMIAGQDSYAMSSFDGYPGQPLPSSWTFGDWSGF